MRCCVRVQLEAALSLLCSPLLLLACAWHRDRDRDLANPHSRLPLLLFFAVAVAVPSVCGSGAGAGLTVETDNRPSACTCACACVCVVIVVVLAVVAPWWRKLLVLVLCHQHQRHFAACHSHAERNDSSVSNSAENMHNQVPHVLVALRPSMSTVSSPKLSTVCGCRERFLRVAHRTFAVVHVGCVMWGVTSCVAVIR